jgi:hypothetical protein
MIHVVPSRFNKLEILGLEQIHAFGGLRPGFVRKTEGNLAEITPFDLRSLEVSISRFPAVEAFTHALTQLLAKSTTQET